MDTRKVTFIATIAAIVLVAVGIGYAYTASTSNSNNDVDLTYLTVVPTKDTGSGSYSADFDGERIKYNSETRPALSEDVSPATEDHSAIAIDQPIIIYTLSDEIFDQKIGGSAENNAMKIGQIFLQVDESDSPAADTYYVLFKAATESKTSFNTAGFQFKVGFQTDYRSAAVAPVDNPDANFSGNPGAGEVVDYANGAGAVSPAVTNYASGITIVKVTLWLTGINDSLAEQKFPVTDIYPPEGTPKAPQQPMTSAKLNFKAIVPEVKVTGLVAATADASIDLSEAESTTMTVTVSPTGASIPNVKWVAINGTGEVTVDANGVVRPVAVGTATVKAVALDGSGIESNTVEITVTE